MACITNNTTTTNYTGIAELLRKIDQAQKEAILNNLASNCDSCAIGPIYNTKPIALYTECGRFSVVNDPLDTQNINLFRIEEVRNNDTVVLRMLNVENGVIVCLNRTVVLRIACICCVQCFDPINCDLCCQNT